MNLQLQQNQNLKIRLFFVVFIVLLASSYLLASHLFLKEPVSTTALDNAYAKTLEREKFAQRFFIHSEEILNAVRSSQHFERFLTQQTGKAFVKEEFKLIAQGHLDVFQIRFIDAQGQEQIRVNRDQTTGKVSVVSESELQNKQDRDYFQESLSKPLDEVWFSAFDLNRENGKVQTPPVPTLRGILPVSNNKQLAGLIVINYFTQTFLEDLMRAPLYDSVLINHQGDILVHHDSQKSWSNLLGLDESLYTEYPDLQGQLGTSTLRAPSYFYRKFDLPASNGLGMVMGLKADFIASERAQARNNEITLLVLVTVFSLILSQIITTVFSRMRQQALELEGLSNRFKMFLDLSAEAVFILTVDDGRLVEYSRASQELLGYSDDEMKNLSVTDWDKEINLSKFQAFNEKIGSEKVEFERRHTRKDGSQYDAAITVKIIEVEGQRFAHATVRDVSEQKKLQKALRTEQNFNKKIVDSANAIITVIDLEGRMIKINDYGQKLVGVSQAEIASEPFYWSRFLEPELKEVIKGIVTDARQGKLTRHFKNTWLDASGERRMFEWSNTLMRNENEEITGIFTIGIDIEASYQLTKKLKVANTIIENAINGVVITNRHNKIIEVNNAFCEISGYSMDELIGQPPSFNQSGQHDSGFYKQMWDGLLTEGNWRGQITNRRKDGSLYTCLMSITVIKGEQGQPLYYAAIYSDISDIEETKNRLHYIAHHDPLTNLPNRLLFQLELDQAIDVAYRQKKQFAVVFFDIDRFKQINDSFGHHQGDALLVLLAERVASSMRACDLFSRLGGDEFALIVNQIDEPSSVGHLVKKILAVYDQPFQLDENLEVNISTSIGIAIYPNDGLTAAKLLSHSDSAMYKAKSLGGNQYQYYESSMTEDVRSKLGMEGLLRNAIEKDELSLVYQPQINLADNTLSGVEALLRWHNVELGQVSPVDFIPVSEETGLIVKLTDFVLHSVAQQIQSWQSKGFAFGHVAVNISMVQLEKEGLPEKLAELLAQYRIAPGLIELEVTEGVMLKKPEFVMAQLHKIRVLGFRISMDDFGTGFSSLTYLKKLPIQTLKIDQSFVSDIPDDKDDVEITKAIIALGRSLNLTLIAEGAESFEQIEFLKVHGCENVQGYYFSKPLSAEALESFALKRSESV